MERRALETSTPISANVHQVSMDTTAKKVGSPKSLLMFSIGAEEVSVIIVPLQCVQTPPAVATEMEDVNISVESFRMALPYAFVLRDTDLNWTTVPACLKV